MIYSVFYKRTGLSNIFSETIREDITAPNRAMAVFKIKRKYGKSIDIWMVRMKI